MPPISLSYFDRTDAYGNDHYRLRPNMSEPDYGFADVCLDSEKYYSAFFNPKAFSRVNERWMLWQPPQSLLYMYEWRRHQRLDYFTHDAPDLWDAEERELRSRVRQFFSERHPTPEQVASTFTKMVQNMNEGNVEALEDLMHISCSNYIKGWRQYLKEEGYSCVYRVHEILYSQPGPKRVLFPEHNPPRRFVRSPLYKMYVPDGQDLYYATCCWSHIITVESCEIFDRNGILVRASPKSRQEHFWKFGWNSTTDRILLYDIDNQVAIRAHDILAQEKLFLGSNAPKDEVWIMTKSV